MPASARCFNGPSRAVALLGAQWSVDDRVLSDASDASIPSYSNDASELAAAKAMDRLLGEAAVQREAG